MKSKSKKPAAPIAQFADGARVRFIGTQTEGTVVSTEFTPDDFGREIQWEMVTVRWDGAASPEEINPSSIELASTTDAERDYADACAFARIHD